jgi:hypothetical protein
MDEQQCDYHQTMDPDRGSITHELVQVVACYKDRPVEDLPPFAYWIDPDALSEVLKGGSGQSSQGDIRVKFDYDGIHVGVSSAGDVWIWEPNDTTP